jgi:hypothetical protein
MIYKQRNNKNYTNITTTKIMCVLECLCVGVFVCVPLQSCVHTFSSPYSPHHSMSYLLIRFFKGNFAVCGICIGV